LKFIFELLRE